LQYTLIDWQFRDFLNKFSEEEFISSIKLRPGSKQKDKKAQ